MLRWILIGLAILIALGIGAILVLASRKPDMFRLSRALDIRARPDAILPFLDDFRLWTAWSPWEKLDPNLRRTYEGAPRGVGASYRWDGKGKAGAGRMEIVAASPERLEIELAFEKPFRSVNRVVFTLSAHGESTLVTWDMTGPTPFPAKIMHVFLDMDRLVGADFERGLAALKAEVEGQRQIGGRTALS